MAKTNNENSQLEAIYGPSHQACASRINRRIFGIENCALKCRGLKPRAIFNNFILCMFFALLILFFASGCAKKESLETFQTPIKFTEETKVNETQEENIQDLRGGQMADIEGVNLDWTGHSGFVIKNNKTIYIDPFQLKGEPEKADIVLITHEHYDHCSIADIKRIAKPQTIIVTVPDCQSKLSNLDIANVTLVKPGDKISVQGIIIEAVPAYNLNKKFHLKENAWVGYVVTVEGKRIYHAGDTDFIPEMRNLKNIDIAIVPISGTYVMTAEEAANAVNAFQPKIAIPMHYGSIIGTSDDAARFKRLAKVKVGVFS